MIASSIAKSIAQPIAAAIGDSVGGEVSSVFNLFTYSGQSLQLGSVGGSGTPSKVSTDSFSNSKMPSPGGTRPREDDSRVTVANDNVYADRFGSMVTLDESVSSNFGETYKNGIAAQNSNRSILHSGVSDGGQVIDSLNLGNRLFTDLMIAIHRSKALIDADGSGTFSWPIHLWAQGEADVVDETTYATYRAVLIQYFADLKSFGNAQLNGSYSPKLVTYQIGNPYVSASVDNWGPPDALLDVGINETDMFCVGPMYNLTFEDNVHLTSLSYRRFGEQIGKVVSAILSGTDWKPCYWTSASRTGTTITLTYNVPSGSLAIDTTNVSNPGNNGFTYSGATITNVALSGSNQVVITIDADAGGTLGYAREQTNSNTSGPTFGARGNVRDSDAATAEHDSFNLYNWACHQEEVIA